MDRRTKFANRISIASAENLRAAFLFAGEDYKTAKRREDQREADLRANLIKAVFAYRFDHTAEEL